MYPAPLNHHPLFLPQPTSALPFPDNYFDIISTKSFPGILRAPDWIPMLRECNRVLRPGGFFLWSATPVYWKDDESVQIWRDTKALAEKMSWKLVAKKNDPSTKIGVAVFQKPKDNDLYEQRPADATPPLCEEDDKPDAAW